MKIILGTAHGKNVPGKCSPDDRLKEYLYSREICSMIKEKLISKGIDCVIDIEDENEPSLKERVNIVNKIAKKYNSIYISIHNDAFGDGKNWESASGMTVRVGTKASAKSKELAKYIYEEAALHNVLGNRWIPSDGYIAQNLYVCNNTICPAVLTENMFQDNRCDVEFLLSDIGKNTIVEIHVNAILKYIENHPD